MTDSQHNAPEMAHRTAVRPDKTSASALSAAMWWDGGERAITPREKACIEEHSASSFSIPLIPAIPWACCRSCGDLIRSNEFYGTTCQCTEPAVLCEQHRDDLAVDIFANAMKSKMTVSRWRGRSGWEDRSQCSQSHLSTMLRAHVEKGDPVDVANFCMMLSMRGEGIEPAALAAAVKQSLTTDTVQGDARAQFEAWASKGIYSLKKIHCEYNAVATHTAWAGWQAALASRQPVGQEPVDDDWHLRGYAYASKQATTCAVCVKHKHTPLRIDAMGGYVCLTCIDQRLSALLGEFGYPPAQGFDLGQQQDAERYRWLRDHYDPSVHDDEDGSFLRLAGEDLDAAIDDQRDAAPEVPHA